LRRLEQIPNIGPAAAADLRLIGITDPQQLRGEDALAMYQSLCHLTKQRHGPCVLDTFMASG
jgi:Pathogenicity locus